MAVDVGTGTTIAYGASTFAAKVLSFNHDGVERTVVSTSNLATTGYHTKMPGDLVEPGQVTLEIQFEPTVRPPIAAATETITITFPDNTTLASSGFFVSWTWGAELEGLMTATAVIQFTGDPTWT